MKSTLVILIGMVLLSAPLFGQGTALDLDGTDDYVELGDVIENFYAVSFEAWIKRGTAMHSDGYEEIITKNIVSGIAVNQSNDKMIFNIGTGLVWGTHVNGVTTILNDQWYHVASTRDGTGTVRLYVNGNLEATVTNIFQGGNAMPRAIGAILPSEANFFAGQFDEIRVWTSARTADELRTNMHKTLTGMESTLEAYYSFDNATTCNGTSGEITDDSANAFDGTCQNMDNADLVTSTAPVGSSTTVHSAMGHMNQSQSIGAITIDDTTDPFDNSQDIYVARIGRTPNTTSGISESHVAEEYFLINVFANVGSAGTYDVSLTFPDPTSSGGTVALYRRNTGSIGSWSLVGTAMPSGGSVTFTGITGFSQFVMASDAALPVELTRFSAQKTPAKDIRLDWQTLSEERNKGFEIEHSRDGQDWEVLGFVDGAIQSSTAQTYTFLHRQPARGLHLYRLKQIDLDGSFAYSKIVSTTIESTFADYAPQVFPNPVRNGEVVVDINSDLFASSASPVRFQLYDLYGRLVFHKRSHQAKTLLQLEALPAGIYSLQIQLGRNSWWEKICIPKSGR